MDVLPDANRGGWMSRTKNMEEMESPENDTRQAGFGRRGITVRAITSSAASHGNPFQSTIPSGHNMDLR
jgi:hypothetical protein